VSQQNQQKMTRDQRRQTAKQIGKMISQSEMWMAIRYDKDGLHVDIPSEDHLVLLCMLFTEAPDLFEMVTETMADAKA